MAAPTSISPNFVRNLLKEINEKQDETINSTQNRMRNFFSNQHKLFTDLISCIEFPVITNKIFTEAYFKFVTENGLFNKTISFKHIDISPQKIEAIKAIFQKSLPTIQQSCKEFLDLSVNLVLPNNNEDAIEILQGHKTEIYDKKKFVINMNKELARGKCSPPPSSLFSFQHFFSSV